MLIFSKQKFKGICKQGYRKYYKSSKYKYLKSYISPTTTITQINDNRNQTNHICGDIDGSFRNICNDINSNNCAQNIDSPVATTKITTSVLDVTVTRFWGYVILCGSNVMILIFFSKPISCNNWGLQLLRGQVWKIYPIMKWLPCIIDIRI